MLSAGDQALYGFSTVLLFVALLWLERKQLSGTPLARSLLGYRQQSFTVLVLKLTGRFSGLIASAAVVMFPAVVLIATSPLIDSGGQPNLLDEPALATVVLTLAMPVLAMLVARSVYLPVVSAIERLKLAKRSRLTSVRTQLLVFYSACCRRLILFRATRLREPGESIDAFPAMGNFVTGTALVSLALAMLVVPGLVFYLLPSILPLGIDPSDLRRENVYPEVFFGATAILTVGLIELLQWHREKTGQRAIYTSLVVALEAALLIWYAAIINDVDSGQARSGSETWNALVLAFFVGPMLALYWDFGLVAIAVVAKLSEPAHLPTLLSELNMQQWTKRLAHSDGEIVVEQSVGDQLSQRWLFQAPRLSIPPEEMAESLIDRLRSKTDDRTRLDVSLSWKRTYVGSKALMENATPEPAWRLHLFLFDHQLLSNDVFLDLRAVVLESVPRRWLHTTSDIELSKAVAGRLLGITTSEVPAPIEVSNHSRRRKYILEGDATGRTIVALVDVAEGLKTGRLYFEEPVVPNSRVADASNRQ